ncbi:MAG: hypothetical protein K6C07_06245 [Bacteroidales bacterium]|nr:hypothetical protein [Bacteroidales bacterium]
MVEAYKTPLPSNAIILTNSISSHVKESTTLPVILTLSVGSTSSFTTGCTPENATVPDSADNALVTVNKKVKQMANVISSAICLRSSFNSLQISFPEFIDVVGFKGF